MDAPSINLVARFDWSRIRPGLRRRMPAAYRGVGNDCVHVTEALSRQVYDHVRHGGDGEEELPVPNTKARLGRFIEAELPGGENAGMRKLTRATIEVAQAFGNTGERQRGATRADAVLLLANMPRRIGAVLSEVSGQLGVGRLKPVQRNGVKTSGDARGTPGESFSTCSWACSTRSSSRSPGMVGSQRSRSTAPSSEAPDKGRLLLLAISFIFTAPANDAWRGTPRASTQVSCLLAHHGQSSQLWQDLARSGQDFLKERHCPG